MSLQAATPDAAAVRDALERLLASREFRNADRLSRFLRYVVEESLRGSAGEIKEYAIGVEVFERGPAFDPRSDSVVRVEARRLRSKLRDYYDDEGIQDPIEISIPKGSYAPVFQLAAREVPRASTPRWRYLLIPAVLIYGLILLWVHWPKLAVTAGDRRAAVIILPPENLGGGIAGDSFCHGLADEVASRLSQSGIRVVTRGAAGPLAARADVRPLLKDLPSAMVLEGSVTFAGDRVRVTWMLVDVQNFADQWVETYERNITDRLGVQSALADEVARAIHQRVR